MDKEKNVKLLTEMEKYNENPYSEALISSLSVNSKERVKSVVKMKSTDIVVDSDTGEVKDNENLVFVTKHWVDDDEFVKLYFKEMGIFFDMTKNQQVLLSYIITKLEWNKDYFYFDVNDFRQYNKMSEASIYRGLALFCEVGLLARSNMYNKYFINPVMIFKGDRIVVAKAYVRAKYPLTAAAENAKILKAKSGKFYKAINLKGDIKG